MDDVASAVPAVSACIDDSVALLRRHRIVPANRQGPGSGTRPPVLVVGGTADDQAAVLAAVPPDVTATGTPGGVPGRFGTTALVHAMDGAAAVVFVVGTVPLPLVQIDLVIEAAKVATRMIFCLTDPAAVPPLRAQLADRAPRFASAPCRSPQGLTAALVTVAAQALLFEHLQHLRQLRTQIVMSVAVPLDERLRAARGDTAYIARTLDQHRAANLRRSTVTVPAPPSPPETIGMAGYLEELRHHLAGHGAVPGRDAVADLRHDLEAGLADISAVCSARLARRLARVTAAALSDRFGSDAGRVQPWAHARLLDLLHTADGSVDRYPVTIRTTRPVRRSALSPDVWGAPVRLDIAGFDVVLSPTVHLAGPSLDRTLSAVQALVQAEVDARCAGQDAALAQTLHDTEAWWQEQLARRIADIDAGGGPASDAAAEMAAVRDHLQHIDAVLLTLRPMVAAHEDHGWS